MSNRLQVTLHENDVFTVNDEEHTIAVSDQFKVMHGSEAAEEVQKKLIMFLDDLRHKWLVDVYFSKAPAGIVESPWRLETTKGQVPHIW